MSPSPDGWLPEPEKKKPQINAIIRMDIGGMKDVEICKRAHTTQATLRRLRKTPLYLEHMKSLQDDMDGQTVEAATGDEVRAILSKAAETAANLNVEFMKSSNEKVAQASVWDILDRAGYPKAQRSEIISKASIMLDEDSAKALGDALRECTTGKVPEE